MKKTMLAIAAGAGCACGAAHAEEFVFHANISALNEVPSNDSPALGFLAGVYDSDANSFSFSWLITDNLVGAPSAPGAHIHMAGVGVNGPIVFGFATDTWALSGSAVWMGLSDAEADALFNEGLYVNFHTDAYPAGEIRGQIVGEAAPSPGTLALAGLGLVLGFGRRRR